LSFALQKFVASPQFRPRFLLHHPLLEKLTRGGLGLLLAVREELITDAASKIKRTFWLELMMCRLTPRWAFVAFLLGVFRSARD
jgi:hypothetical protein